VPRLFDLITEEQVNLTSFISNVVNLTTDSKIPVD
jgi:hypothetical protein